MNYHCDVLEAKIVLGESLVASIGSEFIENNGQDAERQKELSEGKRKQDCETKAFKRLAGKMKGIPEAASHTAGRRPVCIGTGDGYLPG